MSGAEMNEAKSDYRAKSISFPFINEVAHKQLHRKA
jgi:hypothetical protein